MARSFPGGANTDNLATTITAYDSGPWSAFAWAKKQTGGGGTNPRVYQIGTGTSGQIFYSSGDNTRSFEQQYSTAQMLAKATPDWTINTWEFTVITYDGAALNPADPTDIDMFNGDVSTAMVDTNGISTGLGGQVGVGSRVTGLVDLVIGNRQNGLNRCWSGELFCVGMVPYRMSLSDAELLRQGDLSGLIAGTAPIFFFGLEGSDLNSYSGLGPSLTLTATGTSTTSDPVTLFTPSASIPYRETINLWTPVTHRRTPSSVYQTVAQSKPTFGPHYGESLEGFITPTGALQADFLGGGAHFIFGTLLAEFVSGLQDVQSPLRRQLAARRPHIHQAYYSQKKAFADTSTGGTTTNQGVSGAIAPAATLTNQTNKVLAGGITPTGALLADFINGSGLQVAKTQPYNLRSRVRHAAFTYQRKQLDNTRFIDQQLSGSITPTGALQNQTNKLLAGGITPASTLQTDFFSGLQDTQQRVRYQYEVRRPHQHAAFSYQRKGTVPQGANVYSQAVDGNITPTGNLIKQTNKALTGQIDTAGAITKLTSKLLAAGITPTGTLSADFVWGMQDTQQRLRENFRAVYRAHLHSSYTSQRKYWFATGALNFQSLSGQIDSSGLLTKQTNKVTSGGVTPTGEVDQSTVEPLTGTIAPQAIINKLGLKALTAGITPTGSLSADFVSGIQDTQGKVRWNFEQVRRPHLHGAFSYQKKVFMPGVSSYAQPVTGQIDSSGNLIKQTNKLLAGQIDSSGFLEALPVYALNKGQDRRQQQYTAALRKPPRQVWQQKKSFQALPSIYQVSLTATIGPIGNLTKQTSHALTANITPTGLLTKTGLKNLAGSIGSTGAISKQAGKYTTGGLTPVGNAQRLVAHVLSGTCTTSGAPTKKTSKNLAGVITESGNLIGFLISGSDVPIIEPTYGVLVSSGRTYGVLVVASTYGDLVSHGRTSGDLVRSKTEGDLVSNGRTKGTLRGDY